MSTTAILNRATTILSEPVNNQKESPKFEGGKINNRRVVVVALLASAALLAATAAIVAAVFAAYIAAGVAAAACIVCGISALIATRINLSTEVLDLVENLSDKINELKQTIPLSPVNEEPKPNQLQRTKTEPQEDSSQVKKHRAEIERMKKVIQEKDAEIKSVTDELELLQKAQDEKQKADAPLNKKLPEHFGSSSLKELDNESELEPLTEPENPENKKIAEKGQVHAGLQVECEKLTLEFQQQITALKDANNAYHEVFKELENKLIAASRETVYESHFKMKVKTKTDQQTDRVNKLEEHLVNAQKKLTEKTITEEELTTQIGILKNQLEAGNNKLADPLSMSLEAINDLKTWKDMPKLKGKTKKFINEFIKKKSESLAKK